MAVVNGQEELLRNLSKYEAEKVKDIYEAAAAVQAIVVNDARADHPYKDRTTNLTKSIMAGVVNVEDDNVTAEVKAEAEYASYVEMGTSRSKPYPFLYPAVMRAQKIFLNAMRKALKS